MIIPKKSLLSKSIIDSGSNIFPFYVLYLSKIRRNNHYSNNNIDIHSYNAILKLGTEILLFWGFTTPNQSDIYQSLKRYNPRFNGRGDDSVYNRLFIGLKAIMTVFGGFVNSPIAKASINIFKIHTYFGNQNIGSLVIVNCFRPFCFNIQGGQNA